MSPWSVRPLWWLSLASFGWAISFGLGAALSSLHLNADGAGAADIGLNTSLYYLGVTLASPFIPSLMRRTTRSCIVVGMLLDAVVTAAFPWCSGLVAWHGLRLLAGAGTALSLIPMETLVNRNAPAARRARDFAVYAFSVASGIGVGSVLGLALYPHGAETAFAAGGLATVLVVPFAWCGAEGESAEEPSAASEVSLSWRSHALGFGTAWGQGFLEGGTLAFLSLYLLLLGHPEGTVGGLMGGLFAGVVVAQLPLGWLADRVGRRRILLWCHAILLVGLLLVSFVKTAMLLAVVLFVLGACCGALYPLGLALLGERTPPSGLAKANAWYLACNCAGSLSGPLAIGLAIEVCGMRSLFLVGALALAVVLVGARAVRVPVAAIVEGEARWAA